MFVAETVCRLTVLSCHRTCSLDFEQKDQRTRKGFELSLENSVSFHHHFVEMSFLSHTTQNENGIGTWHKEHDVNLKKNMDLVWSTNGSLIIERILVSILHSFHKMHYVASNSLKTISIITVTYLLFTKGEFAWCTTDREIFKEYSVHRWELKSADKEWKIWLHESEKDL